MITEIEKNAAKFCIRYACSHGADQARVSLSRSVMDSIALLDGEIDKVTHNADCSIYMYLFAEGRYGTFSTNKLDEASLSAFIDNALEMVRMLGEDLCWKLPDPSRTEKNALTGKELGLYDQSYHEVTAEDRLSRALSMPLPCFRTNGTSSTKANGASSPKANGTSSPKDGKTDAGEWQQPEGDYKVICEESEWSDSIDDNYLIDSLGFEGRHTETSFTGFSEVTVQDAEGRKYSGFWWDASTTFKDFDPKTCARKALERAVRQIGPESVASGRYKMVLDTSVSSRLISPILGALNANSIQQKVSFLEDSLGKQIFPEGLTLMDLARTPGKPGSRLYDTEGIATKDRAIIGNGVVKTYFTNTYMAEKTGMEATVEDISRPVLAPFRKGENLKLEENDINLADILSICGEGLYVTSFNGGNCNPVTGDFSFGVEGFAFKEGRLTHPIKGLLITGNIVELWSHLLVAGTDARPCTRWQIPSLAFEDVSFSA